MLTLVLNRMVCSHYNFNYANYKTAWEVIVMILNETSILQPCVHIIYSSVFLRSHVAEEKKTENTALEITAKLI